MQAFKSGREDIQRPLCGIAVVVVPVPGCHVDCDKKSGHSFPDIGLAIDRGATPVRSRRNGAQISRVDRFDLT